MTAKKQIAIWGPHTDEMGAVTCRRNGGFFARYRDPHPSVPGGRKPVYHSRFFRDEDVGAGKVKLVKVSDEFFRAALNAAK